LFRSPCFLNPERDGAVLPILHLNGFKIANPTVLARISRQELTAHCRTFLGSKLGLVVTLSLAALGAYLLWNHTGHFIYALPFVFLLACPLMHVFGHHHGHHNKPENQK
jgi:hypothetical protein